MRRIIGIGSPFGADQLGLRAIDLLQEVELANCELIKLDRPGSDLIRYFEGAEEVVIIDAVQAGQSPGRAMRLDIDDLAVATCKTSSHGFGVADTLKMAAHLGLVPENLLLIGIETGNDLNLIPELKMKDLTSLL